jgi:hypothetical protein
MTDEAPGALQGGRRSAMWHTPTAARHIQPVCSLCRAAALCQHAHMSLSFLPRPHDVIRWHSLH